MNLTTKIKRCEQNSLKLEECRVLGGIDTLYCFIDYNSLLYQNLYEKASKKEDIEGFETLGYSGKSKGFVGTWYKRYIDSDVPLYRIGFKDPKKQKFIKNIYIQLEATGIYYFNRNIIEIFEIIKQDLYTLFEEKFLLQDFIVSRTDLNAFLCGIDLSCIKPDMFLSKARSSLIISKNDRNFINNFDDNEFIFDKNNRTETVYIGSKKSPISLKVYDKLEEIKSKGFTKSALIKECFFRYYGLYDNIWNIEYTLKREALKHYNIDNVSDLLKVCNTLWRELMSKYIFVGFDIDRINKLKAQKNQSRLKSHEIWNKLKDEYDFMSGNEELTKITKIYKRGSKEHFRRTTLKKMRLLEEIGVSVTKDDLLSLLDENIA